MSVEPIVPIHNLISKNTCYSNAVFFCNFALTGERNKLLVAKIGEREKKGGQNSTLLSTFYIIKEKQKMRLAAAANL